MAFDIENFPTSEQAKLMIKMVSNGFYDNSYTGKWLFQVMGLEMDSLREHIDDLNAQIFPETATWGLTYHEIKWGLPVHYGMGDDLTDEERERWYQERRRAIFAKRDYRAPMIPHRIEQHLQGMTGYTVRIADIHDKGPYGWTAPHPNTFKVYLIGTADHGNLDSAAFHRAVDRVKQSHTTYKMQQVIQILTDNSGIEQIWLTKLRIAIRMPFFGEIQLDGTWVLDGRRNLGLAPKYGMRVNVDHRISTQNPESRMGVPILALVTKIHIPEEIRGKSDIQIKVSYWKARLPDIQPGRLKTVATHTRIETPTEQINGEITKHTRNYWFLDGNLGCNGERNLNSVYEKEVIE